MALIIKDRVKEITTTTGTGAVSLGGASATFDAFQSVMSNGDTTFYAIVHTASGTDEWEVGVGTWNTGNTLTRTTVYAGSNGASAVNFSSGNKDIFMTYPASKAAVAGEDVTFADITATDITATGTVTLAGDPTTALGAATKEYVDTIAAAGIHYHTPVRVEAPSALTATYDNGTSGVGATLTNSGTQAALVIDGVTLSTSDRVLVYNQTNAAHNGVYTVTNTGSASTNWVLTRATDADSYGASDPDAMGEGDAYFVKEGDTGAGELYVMNTAGTITFGTTNITFTVIAETAVYSAGTGLTLTGTTFSTNQDISTSASPTFNNITVTGTVDGRDVATDGSKLDGIEAGATADQTAAEIKTAYESNSDTNAFTDAEQTKLSGIETGATGDQTASEILTAIKTVDGAGSNLDADLLDGQQGSYYLNTGTTFSGDVSGTYNNIVVANDSHTHDGRYYTESEADSRFANVTGDTFTGLVLIDQELKIQNGSGNHTHFNYNDGSDNYIRGGTTYVDTVLDLNNNNLNDVGNLTVNTNISVGGTVDGVDIAAFKSAYDSHNHDSRYYTETEADSRFVNVTGDTLSGDLTLNSGTATINMGYNSGPHGIQFYDDDSSLKWGFYYRTSPDSISFELGGSSSKWQLETNGDVTQAGKIYVDTNQRVFADNYHPNADKWTTARTLSLSGDASGSVSWDGSANATLSVTVANDSHSHSNYITNNANDTSSGTIAFGTGTLDPDGYTGYSGGFGNIADGGGWTARGVFVSGGPGKAAAMSSGSGNVYFGTQDGTNYDSMSTWLIVPQSTKVASFTNTPTVSGSTIWHAGNDGSGSGLDADKLDGYHLSTTRNSANTVPVRDGNGYLQLGWINTTSGATTSTINKIYASYDNYMRYITPATFRSQVTDGYYLGASSKAADSNLLDGIDSGSFLRSDATDTFTNLSGTSLTLGSGVVLQESSDRADLLQITSSTASWGGLQIRNSSNEGRWSFMTDGEYAGIYNDEDGQWHIWMAELGGVELRHGDTAKINTTSYGAVVKGDGGETLTLQDTGDTHYYATAYLYFKDSAGTAMGYLGKSTYGSYDMTLHAASGGDIVLFTSGGLKYSNGSNEYNIWHAANDGSGSGLDADTVDGYHASSFHINSYNNDVTADAAYVDNWFRARYDTGLYFEDKGRGLRDVSSEGGQYGTVATYSGYNGWEGWSIGGRVVFMHDMSNAWGIYNDVDNEWMIYGNRNAETRLYYNNSEKISTTSTGVSVTGTVAATSYTGDGSSLTGISAGATGGGSDEIFWENGQNVTSNYTITNGKNAMSAGPITVNAGVTVTIGDGETWTVV